MQCQTCEMMRQQPKITTVFKETTTKILNSIYSKCWGLQHCGCRGSAASLSHGSCTDTPISCCTPRSAKWLPQPQEQSWQPAARALCITELQQLALEVVPMQLLLMCLTDRLWRDIKKQFWQNTWKCFHCIGLETDPGFFLALKFAVFLAHPLI